MHSCIAFVSRLGILVCFGVLIFVYSATTSTLPGTVFFVCCALMVAALIINGYVNCRNVLYENQRYFVTNSWYLH
ncbi:unnamed protein product [Trichobilharzia szidati]|nr:unnamed protein product [Trichobilharzia szidati]